LTVKVKGDSSGYKKTQGEEQFVPTSERLHAKGQEKGGWKGSSENRKEASGH
jgi:hypothetical protein